MDNNRLDETVKKTLRSYEVPYNANDWVQMESMLDVAPKHNPLGRSYSPVILFALVIIGAAFLLYTVFKPSETPEKTSTITIDTPAPAPIVKTKAPEPKPVETHSVVAAPVLPPVKKDVPAPVKTVATRSVTVAPAVTSAKKEVKTTEKKVTEKKLTDKKIVEKKTIETKNSKTSTLSSQESKAKLFQKTLEKNKKTTKKEVKSEVKQQESDTVHIDDENDSNRNRKIINTSTSGGATDSLKNSTENKPSKKETRKSKKGKKTSSNDSLPTETIKKTVEQNQKDTLKTGN